jgi:type I restriction enzyme S subunit
LIRVRLNKKISNPWFYYYLFKLQNNPIKTIINQCAQAGIRGKELIKIRVPLPDLSLQNKIVSILNVYDNLIAVNKKRIMIFEQMAEELYKEWFVRFRFPGHENAEFESGIPKGWEVKKIKEIVKRLPFGLLYKAENTESEGKVIVIDQSQDEYVGFHNNEPSHIASIKKPIALFGDHSCKYQLMNTPFSLSENVIPYIGISGILTSYLFYLTKGIIETTEYKRHWAEFVSRKVLVAPIKLQMKFVKRLESIHSENQILKKKNRNLIKQRDLLLPRLMSGKLEV